MSRVSRREFLGTATAAATAAATVPILFHPVSLVHKAGIRETVTWTCIYRKSGRVRCKTYSYHYHDGVGNSYDLKPYGHRIQKWMMPT